MACSEKRKEQARRWYHANKDRLRERRRQQTKAHSAQNVERVRLWKLKNRERVREWNRRNWRKYYNPRWGIEWRAKNAEHIKRREREKYRTQEKLRIANAEKASRRRQRKCAWADREKVKAMYAEARRLTKETGIEHVVDHVIPIKHSLVSGLHNEFNLRVITYSENARKKNKFEPAHA